MSSAFADKAGRLSPEQLVTAVFHCLGERGRIRDDEHLNQVFCQAAVDYPTLFGVFKAHPAYGDSERLHSVFHRLVQGGTLSKPNASLEPYIPSKRAIGDYGKSLFELLAPEDREAVIKVSHSLKNGLK